jgi:hypothetical protein
MNIFLTIYNIKTALLGYRHGKGAYRHNIAVDDWQKHASAIVAFAKTKADVFEMHRGTIGLRFKPHATSVHQKATFSFRFRQDCEEFQKLIA